MKSKNAKIPMVPLGDYIEESDERNSDDFFNVDFVRGVSIEKKFIPTKADMDGVPLKSYKVVKHNEFCYVSVTSRNGGKISLALQQEENPIIVSSSYVTFRVKDGILPEYLYLLFCRPEFDRYSRFNSWGSAREAFDYSEMKRVQIPLPDIDVQRSVVAAYKSLKNIIETNEALIEPLQSTCNAYIVDLKAKYPKKELGPYIEECDERNTDGGVKLSQGISNEKYFQEPKQVAENSKSDRIVRTGQFAYNRATTRNGEKISIAFREGPDCTVSSAYGVFKVVDENVLMSQYLL